MPPLVPSGCIAPEGSDAPFPLKGHIVTIYKIECALNARLYGNIILDADDLAHAKDKLQKEHVDLREAFTPDSNQLSEIDLFLDEPQIHLFHAQDVSGGGAVTLIEEDIPSCMEVRIWTLTTDTKHGVETLAFTSHLKFQEHLLEVIVRRTRPDASSFAGLSYV